MNKCISFFYIHPHLLSDAVHHFLQPLNVQLQGDTQQLLSKSKQQRLQVHQTRQQLRCSGELPGGVTDGAADTQTLQSGSLELSTGADFSLMLASPFQVWLKNLCSSGYPTNHVIQLTALIEFSVFTTLMTMCTVAREDNKEQLTFQRITHSY